MQAAEALFPIIYGELRDLAGRVLRGERPGHTLQPTALVHEAWLRLIGQQDATFNDRGHFLSVAAMAMRRILVNHAKARGAAKRGGGAPVVVLDEALAVFEDRAVDLIALDEAIDRLAEIDDRQARVVELRFFTGLSVDETAQVMDISPRTVHREWLMARAWLRGAIADEEGGDSTNAAGDGAASP